jgi:predicted Zn-dependent peptidase
MKHIKKVLPNGLRVILVPKKESTSVLVSVTVQAGSNYESEKDSGISHFLEHMCFKGTTKRPQSTEISRELDSIGAMYNASTNRYQTEYYVRVRPKHLAQVFDIVSDLYLNPLLPIEEIEKEKGVVCDEIDMYADDPSSVASQLMLEKLFGDQVAGRDVAGTKTHVRSFTREQIKKYRDAHYVAGKTIITLAGNFDPKKALQLVRKAFGKLPKAKKIQPQKYTAPKNTAKLFIQTKDSEQTHVRVAFLSLPSKHKDRRIASLLGEILGGTMSSRLFVRLRQKMGVSYYNYASQASLLQYGYFTLGAGVYKDHVQKTIDALYEECLKMTQDLVLDEELERAKETYVNPMLMSLEMPTTIAGYVTSFEIFEEPYITMQEWERKMRAISKKDIMRVAKMIFKKENMAVVIVGPHEQKALTIPTK